MNSSESSSQSLGSIAKAWQLESSSLIICISLPRSLIVDGVKKIYLQISLEGSSPTWTRIDEKPEAAAPKGVFSDQIRKHLIGAQLRRMLRAENQSLCIEIQARNGMWHLIVESAKPPMMWLIDPSCTVFAKMTRNQSFTKKYQVSLSDLFDASSAQDISMKLHPVSGQNQAAQDPAEGDEASLLISTAQRALLQQVRRRLRTTRKSIKRIASEVRSAQDVEQAQLYAMALKAHFSSIKPGLESVEVRYPEADSPALRISLDPQKSPGENLELKFKYYKKTKGAFEHQQDVLATTERYCRELIDAVQTLENNRLDATALTKFASRLKISEKQKHRRSDDGQAPVSLPYRTIQNASGVEFKIGKGPKQNDELTKSLRGNDWWFHVVQGGGSHICISSRFASNGSLDPSIQRQAAILALHYSKARKACEGEVYMTQKQNLRKTKGLNPGLWLVDRSQILFVRYDASELKAIVGSAEES